MQHSLFSLTPRTLLLVLLASPAAAEIYTISGDIPFVEGSGASGDVMATCNLQTMLPDFIEAAAGRGDTVQITTEPLDTIAGKVLHIEFSNILGTGGGAWSGPKSVTVRGELMENGEVIGSFTAARYSTGGAFGGFKGTCSILGRCVKTLGSDIARWLREPTMGAMLGDAG